MSFFELGTALEKALKIGQKWVRSFPNRPRWPKWVGFKPVDQGARALGLGFAPLVSELQGAAVESGRSPVRCDVAVARSTKSCADRCGTFTGWAGTAGSHSAPAREEPDMAVTHSLVLYDPKEASAEEKAAAGFRAGYS